MSDLTKEQKARPNRSDFNYDEGPAGDLPFALALNTWQYSEIERLLQDLARYESAHKVLVEENKRLTERVEILTESANEWMDRAITAEVNAQQAGDGT